MGREYFFFGSVLALVILFFAPGGQSESPRKFKADQDVVREEMLQITKELGTTCTECHKVTDFADSAKPRFQIAAKHMKLVAVMRQNGFDGKNGPTANCYMCHRGEIKPPAELPKH